jgi:hypothetical protein
MSLVKGSSSSSSSRYFSMWRIPVLPDDFHVLRIVNSGSIMGRRRVSDVSVVCTAPTENADDGASAVVWTILKVLEGYAPPASTAWSAQAPASPIPAYLSGQYVVGHGYLGFQHIDPMIDLDPGDHLVLLVQNAHGGSAVTPDIVVVQVCYKISFL